MENKNNCCQVNKKEGILKGFIFGVIPHIFCIGFILFSVLGSTIFTAKFKQFLLNQYFFYILIVISFLFATITAVIYLRKVKCLCFMGLKNKRQYLITLYSITILANLLMYFVVFPVLANIDNGNKITDQSKLTELSLNVDIPCSGHAILIKDELKKDNGIKTINFRLPNLFIIKYDPDYTSPDKIVSLDIFKTYKAEIKK